jgi:hypothetical protein
MDHLVLYKGNGTISVNPSSEGSYLYKIGSGRVNGGTFVELNNCDELNKIAEEIRDAYTNWIYSINSKFIDAGLVVDDLSVFFLTDLSCKRAEVFDTYDVICSLILLRRKFEGNNLATALLIGVDSEFLSAFKSVFPSTRISVQNSTPAVAGFGRRLLADGLYIIRIAGAWIINFFSAKQIKSNINTRKMFFSFYPQMFSEELSESKYGELCENLDALLVSILSDGMHQRTRLRNYSKLACQAEAAGMWVIDRGFKLRDICAGLLMGARLWSWYWRQRQFRLIFDGIDLSGLLKTELRYSISRVMRLFVFKGPLSRLFKEHRVNELVYYPVEYPMGRMISWVLSLVSSHTQRTGFQMGIVSQRRLEQFLALGEAAVHGPFINCAPIPDKMLAETGPAQSIYRKSGYQNVELMDEIYRYKYLEGIHPEQRPNWKLVAPGLHDGEIMLEQLTDEIINQPKTVFLLKPHPRADNRYLAKLSNLSNVRPTEQPIAQLLAIVSQVFVTYGSVGLEARQLGLEVTVVSIPGRVNTSPLLDSSH